MPPKTKLTKEQKEKLKREEEERKRIEEEEQRQREEEERLLREEEERKEREEKARLKAIEDARFTEETESLSSLISFHSQELEKWSDKQKEDLQWQRYLACDPLPELEDEAGINTFLTMWEMEKDWSDVDTLLEGIRVAEEFRKKVSTALESAGGQLVSIEMRKYLLKAVQRLEKILEEKVHKCIAEVFKCNEQFIDSESGNLCLERKTSDYTFCLWGNLSKNPRVKSFDFSNPAVTVDIPKPLLLADIVICLRIPATDPFSPQCRTYKCRSRPSSEDVVDVDEKKMEEEEEGGSKEDGPADQQEERTSQERVEGGQPAGLTQDTDKSSSLPQQESTQDKTENEPTPGEGGGENGPSQGEGDGENGTSVEGVGGELPLSPEVPKEEDDVLLEEGEVDMRSMMLIGRVMRFDLLRLPPQPKTTGQWTIQQVSEDRLDVYPYPVDPRPAQQQQKEGGDQPPGAPPPQTPGGGTGPPVKITARLPEQFILPSDPTVARWDHVHSHWTTSSVLGVDINHEEGTFTCQIPTCSPLALMIDAHWNMPYQNWELTPVEDNGCVLTITGPHVQVKVNIKEDQCCLLPQPLPQKEGDSEEEVPEPPLNALANKWMSSRDLMKGLLSFGVNIFPSEDAVKYVDTPNKSWSTEDSVYLHMAMLCNVYRFARSKWNLAVPRNQFAMNVTEMFGGKKSNEPEWCVVIGGHRSCRLAMKEDYEEFSLETAEDCEVHPDLYNTLIHNCSAKVSDLLKTISPVLVNNVQKWLTTTRILRFS